MTLSIHVQIDNMASSLTIKLWSSYQARDWMIALDGLSIIGLPHAQRVLAMHNPLVKSQSFYII